MNRLPLNKYIFTVALMICPVYLFSQNGEQNEPQQTPGIQYPAFETFESIFNKNIFNPNRRAQRQDEREVERTPDPEVNILTGTMVTEKDGFAFFEDSRSGDIAVVSTGNTFLGFDVEGIENNKVVLKKDGQDVEVPILMALQREEGKDWVVVSPGERRSSSSSSSSRLESSSGGNRGNESGQEQDSSNSTQDEPSSSDSSGSADVQNDVLKRLLEKRRQETGQ